MYLWGLQDTDITAIDKELVRALIPDKLADMKATTSALDVVEADVMNFLGLHWSNVHILGTTRLQRWLPESFLPFPMLFERLKDVSSS